MTEKKLGAEVKPTGHLDVRVSQASRAYEASADYDAHLREYAEALTKEGHRDESAALVVRAKLDVEIAKDLSASILAFRNATEKGTAEANALSRRVYWLNWILVLVGLAGIGAAWWFWAHPQGV